MNMPVIQSIICSSRSFVPIAQKVSSFAGRSANPPLRPPPPPKKMEIEGRERSRSPNDTEEKDTGDDEDGNKLADDV